MHPILSQGNIVEKVLRDQSGRLARVTFYVYEHAGRIKARVVNVAYLEEALPAENTLALNGRTTSRHILPKVSYLHAIVSPYFDSALIYTLGSKPRAPAFR